MEITEGSYVAGFRIWEKEIPWEGHGITRKGYLFLGAANERSTAHPERDFYIHFHALYGNGIKDLRQKADEVYFFPDHIDDSFHKALRLFAGSSEMAAISSGTNRDQYDRKVKDYQRVLIRWMNENFIRGFRVLHQERNQSITEVIADQRLSLKDFPFRDQVYKLAGSLLKQHFQQQFPQYPSFQGIELTSATLYSACDQALRAINAGPVSRMAQCVLEGLQLGHVESNRLIWSVYDSPYAGYFLDLIDQLEPGKVINRSSLYQGEPGAERDIRFGLEPELVSLVLAALSQQGAIAVNSRNLSLREPGSNGDKLTLEQLLSFTSISKPKPIPEQAVKELFTSYGFPPELLDVPQSRELGVGQFQQKLAEEQSKVVRMLNNLREGPKLGQKKVLTEEEQKNFRASLEKLHDFLNKFSAFTNYARLSNLDLGLGEIRAGFKARDKMDELGNIFEVLATIRPLWDYLKDAREMFKPEDPWRATFDRTQDHILEVLGSREKHRSANIGQQLRSNLENLQLDYMERYHELHQKVRLDREQDQKKTQITADPRWAKLRALSKLNLLPTMELNNLQDKLKAMRSCFNFRKEDLKQNSACPYCGFSPAGEGIRELKGNDLDAIHADLAQLETKWVNVLLENLNTAQAQQNLKLIDPKERTAVQNFLQAKKIPEPTTQKFLDGVENALLGLEVVEIDVSDYMLAITKPGMPCTPDELDKRTRQFLQEHLVGKDRQKVRIQINW